MIQYVPPHTVHLHTLFQAVREISFPKCNQNERTHSVKNRAQHRTVKLTSLSGSNKSSNIYFADCWKIPPPTKVGYGALTQLHYWQGLCFWKSTVYSLKLDHCQALCWEETSENLWMELSCSAIPGGKEKTKYISIYLLSLFDEGVVTASTFLCL